MSQPISRRLFCLTPAALAVRGQQAASDQDLVFRTSVRLIEVYATVYDNHGKYVDGLNRDRFRISENNSAVTVSTFEGSGSGLTCAVLLDTTGSMQKELPAVKNAILKLVDELGESDQIGIFGFSRRLDTLQPFTQDKKAAKNAILRTRAFGATALFDAISQAARELLAKQGRKALVVFTDGKDNASVLSAHAAIQRAKKAGVPVYTVGQSEALADKTLMDQLEEISKATGGKSYEAKKRDDVEKIFSDISSDMKHTYLLAYPAPEVTEKSWRKIQVEILQAKNYKVRAREGYFPD